jgi:hypothetical protein
MPHCDRSGLRRKKSPPSAFGSNSAMPISRAPSSPVEERCARCKIETAGGQNVPAMGTLLRFDTPLFFWTLFAARTQTADHRRGGARGASAATETWIVPSSRSPILRRPGLLRGSHPERRQARRPAGGAADEVRAGRQPKDRQGPWHHYSPDPPDGRGESNRISGSVWSGGTDIKRNNQR